MRHIICTLATEEMYRLRNDIGGCRLFGKEKCLVIGRTTSRIKHKKDLSWKPAVCIFMFMEEIEEEEEE